MNFNIRIRKKNNCYHHCLNSNPSDLRININNHKSDKNKKNENVTGEADMRI